MKYIYFLCFIILGVPLFAQNQEEEQISFLLKSKESGEVIPYANMIKLDGESIGTTTNEQGKGFFSRKNWKKNDRLYISALGYHDLIHRYQGDTTNILLLEPRIYEIEEVLISSKNPTKQIGSFDREIQQNEKNVKQGLFFNYAGMGHGIFVNPKKENLGGLLKSIYYFIADQGPSSASFSIKIMKAEDKIKDNKIYTLDSFSYLHKQPIVVRSNERGWNKIDIENQNIIIPKQPFVILISALYEGEHLKWNYNGIQNYGASLGYYEAVRLPQMKSCIWLKNTLSVIDDGEKGPIPAIILIYEK